MIRETACDPGLTTELTMFLHADGRTALRYPGCDRVTLYFDTREEADAWNEAHPWTEAECRVAFCVTLPKERGKA